MSTMEHATIEEIVRQTLQVLAGQQAVAHVAPGRVRACELAIPVEMSARHVHLSEQDALNLFGGPLTPQRDLSQPGQFLCRERVRLIGLKGVMDNVAVLGPARQASQVEISLTDARALGLKVPIRQSGDIEGTPGILLSSSTSIVSLDRGVIVAGRHIHMSPQDAERFQVRDREQVAVLLESRRPAVFHEVLVRVHPEFRLALHIDADEANGCGCDTTTQARIVRNLVSGEGDGCRQP